MDNRGFFLTCQAIRSQLAFHPLTGKQLACVGERCNPSGKRLLLQIDDGTICSVPKQWTDLAAAAPEIVLGKHRALFRVVDLLGLAQFVDQLSGRTNLSPPERSGYKPKHYRLLSLTGSVPIRFSYCTKSNHCAIQMVTASWVFMSFSFIVRLTATSGKPIAGKPRVGTVACTLSTSA